MAFWDVGSPDGAFGFRCSASPPTEQLHKASCGQVGKRMDHGGILGQKSFHCRVSQLMPEPRQPDGETGDFSMPPALDLCISSTETAGWMRQTHDRIALSTTRTQR